MLAVAAFAPLYYSAEAQDGSVPAKPTNLAAQVSTDQVVLTWDNPKDKTITGYVIERRKKQTNSQGTFTPIEENTGSTDTTFTDNTVQPNKEYEYRIRAINEHGESELSNRARAKTPPPPAPAKPTGLYATATHDRVTLTWDDPGNDSITGYVILRRVRVNDQGGEFRELVADTGTAALTYTDNTVAASTTYTYRIRAINEHGTGQRSRWFHIDTPAAPEPNLAPSGLAAQLNDGLVVLSWDRPDEDLASVTGYEILRSQSTERISTLVADTGGTSTTYVDDSANQASRVYTYGVKAIRDGARSQSSNEAKVQLPPSAPLQMLSAAFHDSVTLLWTDPQDESITGYRIMRADVVDGAPGNFVAINEDTGSADTTYTDHTVEPEHSYQYRVLAINPAGVSRPSTLVAAQTTSLAPQPEGPSGLPSGGSPQPRQNVSESNTDLPGNATTTGTVQVGGSVTGNIEPSGDTDWFRVELLAVGTYKFDLEGEHAGRGTLPDPRLRLYDQTGNLAEENDNNSLGLDSTLIYRATTAGAHYLAAGSGDSTGTYTLSVLGPPNAEQRAAEQQGIQGAFRLNPDIQEDYEDQAQDRYSGKQSRLEVFHNNRWGTVCSERFRGSGNTGDPSHGNLAPSLACQAMNYDDGEYVLGYGSSEPHQPEEDRGNYVRPGGTYPASGPLPIWLDDLMCWTRAEWEAQTRPAGEAETPEYLRLKFLEDPDNQQDAPENQGGGTPYVCAYAGWGLHNGTHREDAGLRCWYDGQQPAEMAGKSLKVQVLSAPERHDGSSPVRVRIAFSEPVDETSETLREHSIRVDGGEVSAVQPENDHTAAGGRSVRNPAQNEAVWIVDIQPNTTEEMTIALDAGLPCEEAAAICTADGRTLSEGISTTVPGPSSLTASFTDMPEAHDGETAFTFRVAFSEDIGISYRSLREHAFTADGGTITSGRRVDDRRNLFEITVAPESRGAVNIALPAKRDCNVSGAICTKGENRRQLTNSPAATVAGPHNTAATGGPTIHGTPRVGETMDTATSEIADQDGLTNVSFSYQWLADGAEINGATSSIYTLAETDKGKAISVRVSFRDDAGNEEALTSATTDAVAGAPPTEPPSQPAGLTGKAAHDSITLTWDAPGDDSITGYVILRRKRDTHAKGEFMSITSDTGTATTTYTDSSVAAETRYTYRIKAINEQGESERSHWLHIGTSAAPKAQQTSQESAPPPTATEPEDGDFADSTETTGQVAIGESIVGRIGTAGDVDWILVQADPGQWFTITLTGYGEGDHTALETPYQQAYHQPDGSEMAPEYALNKGRPPCSAGCTHVEVSQGGSRYVAVASRTEGNTGSYQLTVTLERTNEGADTAADVGTRGFLRMLTPQQFPGFNPAWNRVRGQITPGDADWYRIDLEAGRAYRFGLRQSNTDLRLRLRDSTGTVIGSIRSGRAIHAAACAEGSHYIEVFRPDDAAPATTNYVVQAAYTDGLETAALRSILLNAGQVQLDWQCYGIADSHQVQFRLDGQWTTLSPEGNNPADIQLDYINGGHTGKTAGLPTGDEYADYEFRIARVVDGVATTDYREVSIVVIPDTPRNLRGGWNLRHYRDALTLEWDAVRGDNVFYKVQVKDQEDEEWIDLEEGSEPPDGLIYQQAGKTRIKILAASPRYVSDAKLWETGNEHMLMRVRATQYDQVSPWSRAFDVPLADTLWVSVGTREGAMTAPGQATLTWANPYYSGDGSFRLITTHVMYRMDGEWLHLLPGHDVNGVTVAVESNRAVVSGLPTGLQEYEFSIRHFGRTAPPRGTSLLILSEWSRTITITTDLETPERPQATQTGSGQASVSWDPVADATQYRLRLWTEDRWEELDGEDDGGVSVTMSGTTATVSGLPGDYYWYIFEVQALGPNGVQQSGWSPNIAVFNQHRPSN